MQQLVLMTPHKSKAKEPLDRVIIWETLHMQWEKNSTYQISFTAYNARDADLYEMISVESSLWLNGQEWIVKKCDETKQNGGVATKEVTAWHVYNQVLQVYQYDKVDDNYGAKADDSKEDTAAQAKEYSIQDLLDYYFKGNELGFTYEVHGNFSKRKLMDVGGGSGKDCLSKIADTWTDAIIYPDNRKIQIYSAAEFFKDRGRRLDYQHNASMVKDGNDSSEIINIIKCVGGKHTVEHTVYTGTGGTNAAGPTEPVNGDWTPVIQYVASLYGMKLTDAQLNLVRAQINTESSGREGVTGGDDGLADGPAKGLLQFKQRTFDYYSRPPYTNVYKGFDSLVAFFNIPNILGQINGYTGYSPHGAPLHPHEQLVINPPNPWGWPFPSVGEGSFMTVQKFGFTGGDRTNGFHDGLDFGSIDHPGTDVHAIHGGVVQTIGYMRGLENYVTIVSNDYMVVYQEAFYSQSDIIVKVGQQVKTGDVIGHRNTSHLHIGITKEKDINKAVGSAFSDNGTWLDPLTIIKSGSTSDTVGSDTSTASSEEYYFQPFIYRDEKSIKEWGPYPGPEWTDESYTNADDMRKDAPLHLKPNPSLAIEVELAADQYMEPYFGGEVIRLARPGDGFVANLNVVSWDWYPWAKKLSLSLNSTTRTIIDYQNQRARKVENALQAQIDQLKGLSHKIGQQSQALTQVLENKSETDKALEATNQDVDWLTNGKVNLVTSLSGGSIDSATYNGSPIYGLTTSPLSSNFFAVSGGSSISMQLSANLTDGSAQAYVEFWAGDTKLGQSATVYAFARDGWQVMARSNLTVPANATTGRLVISGDNGGKISRAQVNRGYKVTDWSELR